jgi:hypothetical protein
MPAINISEDGSVGSNAHAPALALYDSNVGQHAGLVLGSQAEVTGVGPGAVGFSGVPVKTPGHWVNKAGAEGPNSGHHHAPSGPKVESPNPRRRTLGTWTLRQ